MKDLKKNIRKLRKDYDELSSSYDLKTKETELLKLEGQTTDPDFWKAQEKAKKVMQEFSDLKDEIEEFKELDRDITTIEDFIAAGDLSKEVVAELIKVISRLEQFKIASFLS